MKYIASSNCIKTNINWKFLVKWQLSGEWRCGLFMCMYIVVSRKNEAVSGETQQNRWSY